MFDRKEYDKKYYQKNKEHRREYNKNWRSEHKEYFKEYAKEWYTKNKEKISERHKKYCKKHYQENRERCIEQTKQWQKNNPEYQKQWWEGNPEYYSNWMKTEKGKAANQRRQTTRRARERKIINTLTADEWLDILEEHNYICAYCGIEFDCEKLPTRDHIIPISRGGDNTKENVVPACRSCNAKKHNKMIILHNLD